MKLVIRSQRLELYQIRMYQLYSNYKVSFKAAVLHMSLKDYGPLCELFSHSILYFTSVKQESLHSHTPTDLQFNFSQS